MFQRLGPAAYKADLSNTIAICEAIGNPERKFRSIHIAGTNGKGSTSHLLASILQSAGYKVGLYTSPHLKDFRERIRMNGKMIPRQTIVKFVADHQSLFEKVEPSFFEWTVGLAFDFFANQKVDIAVIETGLGGRLDSTNVIQPEVSVITNISLDHQNLLGNTLRKIAAEKAGIIKKNTPLVIGQSQEQVKSIFEAKAKKEKAPIRFADDEFRISKLQQKPGLLIGDIYSGNKKIFEKLHCGIAGLYQRKNILTVLSTLDVLRESGWKISDKSIRKGFRDVVKQTGLLGRWQIISKKPLTIADTGHNEDGIRELILQLSKVKFKKLHFVLGVVADKAPDNVLTLLPKNAHYYFCKANLPRAMEATVLQEKSAKYKLEGSVYRSVKAALRAAEKAAQKNDLILVSGSTFVVAEAI
jgi:dihydrofolate synthase / folylpolyglutamate synthase